MNTTLYADAFVTLTFDEDTGLVRYVRSRMPYESVEQVGLVHARVGDALPPRSRLPRGELRVLFDVREATPRNDDAFEHAIMTALRLLLPRISAHAFLAKSAAGRLQLRRLASGQRDDARPVFDNESDALRYLGVSG